MREAGRLIRMMKLNWKIFAGFELLLKSLSATILFPLFRWLFSLSMKISGFRYLTAENIGKFSSRPLPVLTVLLLALFYAALELFEFSGVIYIVEHSRRRSRCTLADTLRLAWKKTAGAWKRHSFFIMPIVLLLTPVLHLSTTINLIWTYSAFDRIWRIIHRHWQLILLAVFISVLLVLFFLCWIYACHYYVLEECTARETLYHSFRMSYHTSWKGFLPLLKYQLILAFVYLITILAVLSGSILFQRIFHISGAVISSFQVSFLAVMLVLFDALILPVMVSSISLMFYRNKRVLREPVVTTGMRISPVDDKYRKMVRAAEILLFALGMAGCLFYLVGKSRKDYTLRIEHLRTMQVTAHRGASMQFPENTMAAFVGAFEQGADWIELDVQESRDGQIYVMHDTNFFRTTGVQGNAWEMDYRDIAGLDAGSSFSRDFAGEKVPLLEEVILFAKENGIRLNIELKPSGYEKNIVDSVVSLIEEYQFEDQCVITSQKYRLVEEIKSRNEKLSTVYVMGLAYGAINALTSADAFSIRSTSISKSLVRDLHNRGIEVYAWTVDSRDNINRMIDLGVDNIITNNVPLAIECINDSITSNILMQAIKSLREWIR